MGRGKFDRKYRPRNVGKKVIIVCEGDTEELYFEAIRKYRRLSTVKINVVNPNSSDPLSIVKKTLEIRESLKDDDSWLKKDQFWAIFDGDEHKENNIDNWLEALALATEEGIELGISNPSFELWYLLHFQQQMANIHRVNAKTLLKKHLPQYTKTSILFPVPLEAITQIAKKRAVNLKDKLKRDGLEDFTNPSTEIHLLVDVLLNL